jgi:mannose-6-phosphate isomerase
MPDKEAIFQKVALKLKTLHFSIVQQDENRPWGGYFVIDEKQAALFAQHYFPDENFDDNRSGQRLSPKILMVAPGKRLSWQYHNRRAEIWKSVGGPVQVATSDTDEEELRHTLHKGEIIHLRQGERHRLIGTDQWGIVAEIWVHTDPAHPSDEDDIIRLQDDFGR